jgi:hypothetical protein
MRLRRKRPAPVLGLTSLPRAMRREIYSHLKNVPDTERHDREEPVPFCNRKKCQLGEEQNHKTLECEGYCNDLFAKALASAGRDWPPLSGLVRLVGPIEDNRKLYLHPRIRDAVLRLWALRENPLDHIHLMDPAAWPSYGPLALVQSASQNSIVRALVADKKFMRGYLWCVTPDLTALRYSPLREDTEFLKSLFAFADSDLAVYEVPPKIARTPQAMRHRAALAAALGETAGGYDEGVISEAFRTDDPEVHKLILEMAVKENGLALRFARGNVLEGAGGFRICVDAVYDRRGAIEYVPNPMRVEVMNKVHEMREEGQLAVFDDH